MRLSWYESAPALAVGERWSLTVRLKRPHGFSNPGGFDYERWLFQRGIQATGYVRSKADNRRLGPAAAYPLARLREGVVGEHGRMGGLEYCRTVDRFAMPRGRAALGDEEGG